MSSLRLAIIAAFIAGVGIHNASALEIDNTGASNPVAANLADPDDNVPVAHLDDNGTMQQSNSGFKFQMQGGSSPYSNNSGPSAFDRAQQNQMGQ